MKYDVTIKTIMDEAEGVKTFILEGVSGTALPKFTAGSHSNIELKPGLTRAYSLVPVSDSDNAYAISVRLDPKSRGGSAYLHTEVVAGSVLSISEPANNFKLNETSEFSCFFAGGIGVTPFLSMAERLNELGRPWEMHYASRTRASCPYVKRLEALAAESKGKVFFYFDEDAGSSRLCMEKVIEGKKAFADFYCCGPVGMLDHFVALTADIKERAHLEYLASNTEASTDSSAVIECARSGKTLQLEPGRTILEVLIDNGLDVEFSCREGTCGTCEVPILEGEADHRDMILSDEEKDANESLMVCCSGAKTAKLVLDI